MRLSKKNRGSIAGNSNKTAKTTRTLTTPLTSSPQVKKTSPPLLAPVGNSLSSNQGGLEETGGSPASFIFPHLTDPTLQESRPILDEVIDGLDDAFDSVISIVPGTDSNQGTLLADDEASIQELFCQIAATYSVPLKNLIFALQSHTATRNTIEFCRPILHSIRSAAETIKLNKAVQHMEQFDAALAEGQSSADPFLKDEVRKKILDAYGTLAKVLPETFHFGEESRKREDIIIHSLLQQIQGVGWMTFEKLSRSGLGSLHLLVSANPEDLAAVTGIQRKLCGKICNKVQLYFKDAEQRSSQTSQSGYHSCLVGLTNKLRKLNHREKAGAGSGSISPSPHKGRTRSQRRNQLLLEVEIILAELGELELILLLQKASPKKQLQILNEYLPG